jgi:tRNA threonylcarbamoyladenosine biosynthesis protein TsaE
VINEYRSDTTAELVYHFDLYRLESLEEALEIGVEDYFDSGAVCLIEWPDRIADILPLDTVTVDLTVNPDQTRTMTIVTPE